MIKPAVDVIIAAVPRDRSQVARDLVALSKPRVLLMVLASTLAGYFVALDGPADFARVIHVLIGTFMAAGGTLALNQYVERDVDALMERTRRRPLPDHRLQPLEALLFAGVFTSAGVMYLAVSVGIAVAGLTLATTILYLGAYTPLKTRTSLSTSSADASNFTIRPKKTAASKLARLSGDLLGPSDTSVAATAGGRGVGTKGLKLNDGGDYSAVEKLENRDAAWKEKMGSALSEFQKDGKVGKSRENQ